MTMKGLAMGVSAIFYLRPGNLYKDFYVAEKKETVDKGKVRTGYKTEEAILIHAVLANATPKEIERWEQIQHPITHVIVDRGKPKAKEGALLTSGDRKFYVQGVDEPGQLGLYSIYYVEERRDL